MMRWETPTVDMHVTVDGRYAVKPVAEGWGAYDTSVLHVAREIGVRESSLKARGLCEAEEARLRASHRKRA